MLDQYCVPLPARSLLMLVGLSCLCYSSLVGTPLSLPGAWTVYSEINTSRQTNRIRYVRQYRVS